MKHSRTTFAFTPELGAKLRALRRQRSLTLRGLAVMMGRDSQCRPVRLVAASRATNSWPRTNPPAVESANREPMPLAPEY